MKKLLTIILAIIALDAFSCSCFTDDLDSLMKFADFAFIGEAIRNVGPDAHFSDSLDQTGNGITVEFKVSKIIKGTIADDKIIIDQRSGCSHSFKFGSKYLVFGYDHMMIPMTPEERNQDYLFDEMIYGASEGEIEEKVEQIENFFNDLRQRRSYVYTDGCNVFDSKSEQYKKVKKYSRKHKASSMADWFESEASMQTRKQNEAQKETAPKPPRCLPQPLPLKNVFNKKCILFDQEAVILNSKI